MSLSQSHFLLAAIAAVILSSPAASAAGEQGRPLPEILKLSGQALDDAAATALQHPDALSTADLLQLAQHIANDHKSRQATEEEYEGIWPGMMEIFQAVANRADPSSIAPLAKIYKTIRPEVVMRAALFDPIYVLWMKREMAAMKASPPRSQAAPSGEKSKSPQPLAEETELQKALQSYLEFEKPYKAIFPMKDPEKNGGIYFQGNMPAFCKIVDDFLDGRGKNVSQQIRRFYWGGSCGTGMEQLEVPQRRMLVMALIKEGRLQTAAAAALGIGYNYSFSFDGNARRVQDDFTVDFLKRCGVDWESILLGRVVALGGGTYEDDSAISVLSRNGSPRAARLLLQILPSSTFREPYLYTFAAFITPRPGAPENKTLENHGYARISPGPVPYDLQDELFQAILREMKPDASLDELNACIDMCRRLHRPEASAKLHMLLNHPSGKIVDAAAAALRDLGEKVDVVGNNNPVKFQLMLNGKPFANTAVQWIIGKEPGITTSRSVHTDAGGFVQLDRDEFVDPTHKPKRVAFIANYSDLTADTIRFRAEVDPPKDLNVPVVVNAVAHRVVFNLALNRPADFYKDKQMSLRISPTRNDADLAGFANTDLKMNVAPQVVFDGLEAGAYAVDIFAPGAAHWHSDITISADSAIDVPLKPGTDITLRLKSDSKDSPQLIFFRDGRLFYDDYSVVSGEAYRGFPAGHYKVYAIYADDLATANLAGNWEKILKTKAFAKCAHEFVIPDDNPALMDLGEITPVHPAAR